MCKKIQHGFSLIELLLVLVLISIIAAASFVQLVEKDDQARYEATKQGHFNLEEAIFGLKQRVSLNGAPIQKGFLHDTGVLPEDLQNLITNDPATSSIQNWGTVGSEINSLGNFSSQILPHIRVKGGWRGPYFVRGNLSNQPLSDGWDNPFVYQKPDFDSNGNQITSLLLYSKGKKGEEDDPNSTPSIDDEIGYEDDFPQGDEKEVNTHEYSVAPVTMPDSIRIIIPTEKLSAPNTAETYFISVIYPGLNLLDETFNFNGINGNSHPCIRVGDATNLTINFSELEEVGVIGTNTVFLLKRKDGKAIKFQIMNILRYQIAVINSNKGDGTIANHLVSVYPKVFTFLPGQSPPPAQAGLLEWELTRHGNLD